MQLTGILAKIIATKYDEVAAAKTRLPQRELEQRANDAPQPRGFRRALAANGCSLIAEVKTASPSKGLIRDDVDPLEVARIYASNGATCISVLTDEQYFQGSLDRLQAIRNEVGIPLLRKDFIIDPYQLYEAREAGADAVLLIAACLEDELLGDLLELTHLLGLDALVEVHDEAEMARVGSMPVTLVGINNRDLRTFSTDLAVTGRLAAHAPEEALLVSESGLFTSTDVATVHDMGADAVLIGEALMRAEDIGKKVREIASIS